MARKKAKFKTAKIDARVSDRLAYSVEIAARKAGMSMSGYIGRAVEEKIIRDGLDDLMDKTWSSAEQVRVVNLAAHAPELLTDEERDVVNVILRSSALWSRDGKLPDNCDPELWISLRGGVVDMDAVGRFWGYIVQTARKEIPEPDFAAMEKDFWAGAPRGDFAVVDDFEELSRAD